MCKKKKVKAGVLLYAMMMAAVFSLLLQFYLNRQVSYQQHHRLGQEKLIAYAMAKKTSERVTAGPGILGFDKGTVQYQQEKDTLKTSVSSHGRKYLFHFLKKETKPKEQSPEMDKKEEQPQSEE